MGITWKRIKFLDLPCVKLKTQNNESSRQIHHPCILFIDTDKYKSVMSGIPLGMGKNNIR